MQTSCRTSDCTSALGAARRRATTIRRRRVATAAGATALVLPLAASAILALNPIGGAGVRPADQPDQGVLPTSFAGRTLIDSKVARGAGDLVLTVRTDGASQWVATCFGVGGAYTLHQSIDGLEGQSPCLDAAPSDPPWGPRLDEGAAELAGTHTMRIWITRTSDGQPAAPSDAVLAAGAYRLPEQAAVVSGASVYDLEESEGTVWKLAHTSQSVAGAQTFTARYDSGTSRCSSRSSPRVPPTSRRGPRRRRPAGQRPRTARCRLLLARFVPAGSHRVRLTVRDPAPADAVLGVVWRTPVG